MATKKDLWNIQNPNLLNSEEILASNESEINISLPKTKSVKESLPKKSINLPYKSIFDQVQVTKTLFDTPQQIQKQNPNLLTYQEYDYLVKGEDEENKAVDIITVNNSLKSGNFILAEEILGRKLTPVEIARRRVSDETLYTMPSSEPQYKTFENLNLVFDTTDPQEENKINELSNTLATLNIPYSITEIDDNRIQVKSGSQNKSVLFPRVTTTKSYDDETQQEESRKGTVLYTPEMIQKIGSRGTLMDFFTSTLKWPEAKIETKIRTANVALLKNIAEQLGFTYKGEWGMKTKFQELLLQQVQKELSREMPEIEEKKEQPFEIVEKEQEGSVSIGSGLRRKFLKKKIYI